jgi:hypothetical protein
LFDRERAVLLSMAENVARATLEQIQRLLAHLVERVDTADRHIVSVIWTPPVDATSSAILRGRSGYDCPVVVPPRGFEPLIFTLKG